MITFYGRNIEAVGNILARPKIRYEICYQYWTLAECSNRFLALFVWWLFNTFKIKGGCVLVVFADDHYLKTIRPIIPKEVYDNN